MSGYISIDELTALVPAHVIQQLSDDDCTGDINNQLVKDVITDACELVDGYLRGRYTLPFATTPTLVKRCAKQLARYMLYERRPEGFELPDAVTMGYKNAIKLLEKIRDGLVSIGVPQSGVMQPDDGEFKARVRASKRNTRGFSAAVLDKF